MRLIGHWLALIATTALAGCGDELTPAPAPPVAPVGTPAVLPAPATPAAAPDVSSAMTDAPLSPPASGKLVMPDRRNVEIEPAKQEAVKQRILSLFPIIRSMKLAEGAGYVVYRGEDPTRKRWHELCDYAKDKEHVDEVLGRIGRLLQKGEPVFTAFKAQRESEGVWLAWEMTFGAKQALIACLEIDGTIAIGDID